MSSTPRIRTPADGDFSADTPSNDPASTEPQPPAAGVDRPLAPGLYLVATPIGNLEDITLRALRVLRSVDRIACEDTRQTAKLLGHFGIRKPTVSFHLHNEGERAGELLTALRDGGRIAVVSDAGMPGIADPGTALVTAAITAGVPVFPVPGANAALSALIASGLPTERFAFSGFLPAKEGGRRSELERLRDRMRSALPEDRGTQILYETPHRVLDSLTDVVAIFGPEQPVVLAREITKLHEEFLRGSAAEVLATLRARPAVRGEMVLLLDGNLAPEQIAAANNAAEPLAAHVQRLLREGLPEKVALKQAAKVRNLGKSEAYREWQRTKAH